MILSSCEDDGKNNSKETSSDVTADTSATTTNDSVKPSEDSSGNTHVHSYGEWVTVAQSTCQKEGSRVRACSCGSKETVKLAKVKHNYVENVCTMCKQNDQSAFVSDYAPGEANVVGSDDTDLNYTSQADYVYFSDENKIQKIKKSAGTVEAVYKVSAGNVFNVNVVGDWVYFFCQGSTVAKSYIAKVRTDGSGFEKLVTSLNVWEMLVVKDIIYYTTITQDWTYVDYGKDAFPLYSVSVNGGTPIQIHDGAISDLTADATYLYFVHITEDDASTVCRIKHGSTSKSVLLKNTQTIGLSLENSKLYFLVEDPYDFHVTLASISINGGSYTTYGTLNYIYVSFYVVGNKAYFIGSTPMSEQNPEPPIGLMEYNMSTKTFKLISEKYNENPFAGVFGTLICESYDYELEKLEYIEIYDPATEVFKKINMS